MATQRQINNALLESNEVMSINRIMKKLNSETDNLYESLMDEDHKAILNNCSKIMDICLDITTKTKKKYE
jgi:hypothetical protein